MTHDQTCTFDPKYCRDCKLQAEARADERKRILSAHKKIDADNSCGDPDCCGGPYPMMVCDLCGVDWPCPTVDAARGGEHEHSWERLYGEKTHRCECGAYLKDENYGGEQA